VNWASGFAVLTFNNGRLLEPEVCVVQNGEAWFTRPESVIWQAPENAAPACGVARGMVRATAARADTVNGLLGGVVRCGGKYHKEWQPWVMPNIEETP
jgi:hypothetical protein